MSPKECPTFSPSKFRGLRCLRCWDEQRAHSHIWRTAPRVIPLTTHDCPVQSSHSAMLTQHGTTHFLKPVVSQTPTCSQDQIVFGLNYQGPSPLLRFLSTASLYTSISHNPIPVPKHAAGFLDCSSARFPQHSLVLMLPSKCRLSRRNMSPASPDTQSLSSFSIHVTPNYLLDGAISIYYTLPSQKSKNPPTDLIAAVTLLESILYRSVRQWTQNTIWLPGSVVKCCVMPSSSCFSGYR